MWQQKKKSNSVWPDVCRIFFFSHNKMNRMLKKKTKNLQGNVKWDERTEFFTSVTWGYIVEQKKKKKHPGSIMKIIINS